MDIDLFLTKDKRCGLLCTGQFTNLPTGVIFDAQTLELTIEFLDDAPFHLNIPVDFDSRDMLLFSDSVFFAFMQGGQILDTVQTPLMYLNDPYSNELTAKSALDAPIRTIQGFDSFIKNCKFAQPVHRIDEGNEDTNIPITSGQDLNALEYAPQLQRQRQLENGPKGPSVTAPGLQAVPQAPAQGMNFGPSGPGGVPMAQPATRRAPPTTPPKDPDETE